MVHTNESSENVIHNETKILAVHTIHDIFLLSHVILLILDCEHFSYHK